MKVVFHSYLQTNVWKPPAYWEEKLYEIGLWSDWNRRETAQDRLEQL